MKVLSLVGARPQFIKEAILNIAFRKSDIEEVLVNSGQHYDTNMSDVFFHSLNISSPKYNLKIGSGNHGEMTGKIMIAFEKVVQAENPDLILVFGDTNTTLAGAVVASKLEVPVGHVEAGIRMLPKTMPEEINRVLVDHVSSFLFCPTKNAISNLAIEGIKEGVFFTGDVMFDLFLLMQPKFESSIFKQFQLYEKEYHVLTMHRNYNVDKPKKLERLLNSINRISQSVKVVFPIHPRTKKRVDQFKLNHLLKNILVIEPLNYLQLMGLVMNCDKVITDSGGLQKEAYFAGKPALVLMPDTGWKELTDIGFNILCNENSLEENLEKINSNEIYKGIYGNGQAGEKIVEILKNVQHH